ncbi:hypothetical protein NC651_017511 [Populus alba x Populus x berolinensis]|nr:hypothetical protein NC651_017511 [Populus alba x Populus x berolinensis]
MDFIKVFDQTVREIKREVNLKVLKVPEIEQKVLDATDDAPWGPHGSAMAEIAQATKKFTECQMIMNVLWTRLGETGKDWRLVYKALTVIEYLVAHGSDRAVDDIIEHTFQISSLTSFEYVEPNGKDSGLNVRKKAETIVSLLNNKDKIYEVRNKAAANRDKYVGLSSSGISYKSSTASFGSSSSSFQSRDRYGGGLSGTGDEDSYDSFKQEKSRKDSYTKSHRRGTSDDQDSTLKKGSAGFGSKDQDNMSSRASKSSANLSASDKKNSVSSNYDDDDFDPRGTSSTTNLPKFFNPRCQRGEGDIIDCIDIYKQPAFDHPALRNHKDIQMAPSYDPNIEETATKANRLQNQYSSMSLASRLWAEKKKPSSSPPLTRISIKTSTQTSQQSNRSVAILLTPTEGYSYSGFKGDIKAFSPTAVTPSHLYCRKKQPDVGRGKWYSSKLAKSNAEFVKNALSLEVASEVVGSQLVLGRVQSDDGRYYCLWLDIYKQPAFDSSCSEKPYYQRLQWKNARISRAVDVFNFGKKEVVVRRELFLSRRIRRRELLRTNGRKSPEHLKGYRQNSPPRISFMHLNNTKGQIFYPTPENRFLVCAVNNFESVEAGWTLDVPYSALHVTNFFPGTPCQEYSDSCTDLDFLCTGTVDGYQENRLAFDLTCYGFVQTSTEIALGGAVEPGSSSFQKQYGSHQSTSSMDPTTTNWWLVFHDIAVGYWPGSLFSLLKHSATSVEWGGQSL